MMIMRYCVFILFTAAALVLAGCGAFEVEAGFKRPAELTATAEAGSPRPTPTPKPQLGKLAFVQGGDIWVKELPDGEPRRLTQDGRNDSPLWSPSGEWLAFRRDVAGTAVRQLWVVRETGTDAHAVDTMGAALGRQLSWSPSEDRLAYISGGGLFVVNADGSGRRQLVASPPEPEREGVNGVNALAWSPDGQWVAFEKLERDPPQGGQAPPRVTLQGLLRAKADGSEVKEVYLNPDPFQTQSYLAGWSPDGRSILFWQGMLMSSSLLADGAPLMIVGADGGAPRQIAKAMLARRDLLDWSPDGRRLVYVDGSGRQTWENKALTVTDSALALQRLSEGGRSDLFPAWSPDGQRIAFTSAPAAPGASGGDPAKQTLAQRRIWCIRPEGGAKQLTDDPNSRDERPRWSSDGAFILFARFRDEKAQLWLMRADGSEQRPVVDELTPNPSGTDAYGYVDWGRAYDWWKGPARGLAAANPSATHRAAPASSPIKRLERLRGEIWKLGDELVEAERRSEM